MRWPAALALLSLFAMPAAAQDASIFGAELLSVPVTGDVSFSLKTPAFVAVFELIPGRGITQIYPANSGQARQPVAAGTTWIPSYQVAFYRRASAWNASWSATSAAWSSSNTMWDRESPFRTYMLIASDKPLHVGSPMVTSSALRRVERWQPLSMNGIGPATFDALIEAVRPTNPGAIIETDALEAVYHQPSVGSFSQFADEDGIDLVCFDGYNNFILTVPRSAIFSGLARCSNVNMFGAAPPLNRMGPQRPRPDSTVCRDSARVHPAPAVPVVPAGQTGQADAGGIHAVSHNAVITEPAEIGRVMDDLRRPSGRTEVQPGAVPGARADAAARVDTRRITVTESGRSGATPAQRDSWRGDNGAADRNTRGEPTAGSSGRSASPPANSPPPPAVERPAAPQPAPVRAEPKRDIERKP